ncbi:MULTISPECIES: hypothetical protein [unclassified Pseudomonas]|uniref:hypothetical protein n=1 Tax=unclassified Pseudomonas TaxID=196821 RepID=UPI000BCEB6DE|nr:MULTISPECIES: hypothetical protein [unclassified Pseudomonas]PVZ19926.1 hypothetical protein F474_00517 [Pseudomonas sp. URIL14HWK12:I12]PVZ26992.1 hypothetical protein F470_00172 [Pseudomonas sp. URIL14HWK12:I10]PVZ37881.1 hypothetical protein F472_00517 [Pseudomonas sp. URIL14HWK12:I11]SNZ05294.1 hypothetical protein SAMN05660463_00887 [Pseudomonas sp. URIL14HWK12:I9]
MNDIYDRGRALAIRMLAPRSKGGKGLEMTLLHRGTGQYDPEQGTVSPSETTYQGSALRQAYAKGEVDGTLIRQSDVRLIVSPVQLTGMDLPAPQQQDRINFDGTTYTVVAVDPWNYAGVDIGFDVQARA